jgi:heptose-I-phosphate ethanolaminephosphotransferase
MELGDSFVPWNNMNKEIPKHFLQRPYILDYLPHSLADLYQIESKQIDSTKSIFNNAFKVRQRIVRDTIIVD